MTDQEEHHAAILGVLDDCIKRSAEHRGLQACDGRSTDQECEVGDLHGPAAGLAIALARMIDDPTLTIYEQVAVVEKLEDFRRALRRAFSGKPKLS